MPLFRIHKDYIDGYLSNTTLYNYCLLLFLLSLTAPKPYTRESRYLSDYNYGGKAERKIYF